jgi:hypothetical protein
MKLPVTPKAHIQRLEARVNTVIRRRPAARSARPRNRRTTGGASARAPAREDPHPSGNAKPGNRANVVTDEAAINLLCGAQEAKGGRREVAVTCGHCHGKKRGVRRLLLRWWRDHSCLRAPARQTPKTPFLHLPERLIRRLEQIDSERRLFEWLVKSNGDSSIRVWRPATAVAGGGAATRGKRALGPIPGAAIEDQRIIGRRRPA